MKKFTSLLLAVLMVASLFSTFVVFTSAAGNELLKTYDAAAEGDLLYEAKFGQKEGCYQSAPFAIGKVGDETDANTYSAQISDDGKEIQIKYLPKQGGFGARRFYYGGKIDGLKVGGGQKYTIVYNAHVNVENAPNYGVYYNFPTSFASDDLLAREEYMYMLGYYGTPSVRQTLTIGGSKYTGKYVSRDRFYVGQGGQHDELKFPEVDGFNEIAIEVEDNAFRVYIDNIFFDEGYVYDGTNVVCENLGISFYLYNNQTYDTDTFTVKNVKVFKGHTKKNTATFPDYAKESESTTPSTNVLLKEYAAAADGDLLYTVKMNATDGVYVPKVWQNANSTNFVPTDNTVEFINPGVDGAFWWGNIIEGLKVNKDTKYTFSYKVQNKIKANGGVGFVTTRSETINKCFNFYGCFNKIEGLENQPSVVIQKGTGKIKGDILAAGDNYTSIYPLQDAEGYIDVMVEIDGLVWSVYYKSTVFGLYDVDPYWALFETYDMTEDLTFTGGEAEICFMTYTYNKTTNWMAKDVNIYKGLTVDKTTPEITDAPTTTEAPTEAPTTTAKPQETTKAPAATTKAPTTTEAPKTQKGCGGMVAGGLAIVAIASLGAVVVSKKKEN
jgi:hypothetical protein